MTKYTTKYMTVENIPQIGGMLAQELNDVGLAARNAIEQHEPPPNMSGLFKAISDDTKTATSLLKIAQVHKVAQALVGGELSTYVLIIETLDMGISIGLKMAAERAREAQVSKLEEMVKYGGCPDCADGTRYPTLGADYVEVAGVVTEARCITCGQEVK